MKTIRIDSHNEFDSIIDYLEEVGCIVHLDRAFLNTVCEDKYLVKVVGHILYTPLYSESEAPSIFTKGLKKYICVRDPNLDCLVVMSSNTQKARLLRSKYD